jgi:hypothetical protein
LQAVWVFGGWFHNPERYQGFGLDGVVAMHLFFGDVYHDGREGAVAVVGREQHVGVGYHARIA